MKRTGIKALLAVLSVFALILLMSATATCATVTATGTCGGEGDGANLIWTVKGRGLYISGDGGAMADYTDGNRPWAPYGDTITLISFEHTDRMVEIGAYAFAYDLPNVNAIYFGKTVSVIGSHAFAGCTGLKTPYLEAAQINEFAFEGCTGMTSVTLDEAVTQIGEGAFRGCTSLKRADIFAQATALPERMFENCDQLTGLTLPTSLTQIPATVTASEVLTHVCFAGSEAQWTQIEGNDIPCFANAQIHYNVTEWGYCGGEGDGTNLWWVNSGNTLLTVGGTGKMKDYSGGYETPFLLLLRRGQLQRVVLEEGVESLGSNAFYDSCFQNYNNHADFTVDFGSTVKSIGKNAFMGCRGITRISIPDTVVSIDRCAFFGCEALVSVRLPAGLDRIEDQLFDTCKALTDIVIPDGVTYIGRYAFEYCYALSSVHIPDGVTQIGCNAFSGCRSLTEIVIPDSVAVLGERTFYYCDHLSRVTVGTGVTEIPKGFCDTCGRLSRVDLPEGLISIGEQAFKQCHLLRRVTLPTTLESIGEQAFTSCTLMADISIPQSVTSVGSDAFYYCHMLSNVYYAGNEAQWAQIEIGENNQPLTNAAVSFNTGIASFDDLPAIPQMLYYGECGICPDSSYPGTGTPVNMVWTLTDDGMLTIGGTGRMYTYKKASDIPWLAYSPQILNAVVREGVENLCAYAFNGCMNLTEIRLPATLSEISDDDPFNGCRSLQGFVVAENSEWFVSDAVGCLYTADGTECIRFPQGNPQTAYTLTAGVNKIRRCAFRDCVKLTDLVLPEGTQEIFEYAFMNCSGLEKITIPASLRRIVTYSFDFCTSLQGVYISDLKAWNRIRFEAANPLVYAHSLYLNGELVTDLTELYGETEIGEYAFRGWNGKRITVPDTVAKISLAAFSYCVELESVYLPQSVTEIENSVFSGCTSLRTINLPDGLTRISDHLFERCGSLTGITIPEGVETIGNCAFSGCSALADVTLPESITVLSSSCFENCRSLTRITLPARLTEIQSNAFVSCAGLTEINIPESVEHIRYCAFFGCSNLRSIVLPAGLTAIENKTFQSCVSLTEVTIPSSVASIGTCAFLNCGSLRYVFYSGTEEQWQEISVYGGNEKLLNAVIHYGCAWHTPGAATVENETPASCTTGGSYDSVAYCTVCGAEISREQVPVLPLGHGHTLGLNQSGAPSTCTVQGYEMTVCLDCGEVVASSILPLDPTAHAWGEWTVITPATYMTEGLERRECAACHAEETRALPKLVPDEIISDPDTGITLNTQQGVLPEGTTFEVDDVFDGTCFTLLNREMGNVESTMYNITPKADGENVQPNGWVLVRLPLPAGYDPANVSIYYISTDTGVIERMDSYIEDGYICFQTNHFSVYAIVTAAKETSAQQDDPAPGGNTGGRLSFFARILEFFHRIAQWFKKLFIK